MLALTRAPWLVEHLNDGPTDMERLTDLTSYQEKQKENLKNVTKIP